MNSHDIFKEAIQEKELLEKIIPKTAEMQEIDNLIAHAENPKVLAAIMLKVVRERERTNKLLEEINDKFDKIMLTLKTSQNIKFEEQNQPSQQTTKFEILGEQDQLILKTIEERGGCTATDIKTMLNYKGLNAACQRLNKLYREGHLKKIQSGKKVIYLAKG
jgi:uncharacterized membrane protein